MLTKLSAKGIQGKLLNWLNAWLAHHTQTVVVNTQESTDGLVESGVPQATVPGPSLFVIFIDDLDDEVAGLLDDLLKFADDTKGLKEIGGLEDCEKMQQALDKLYEWAKTWEMQFNLGKCKIMHIGRNNPRQKYKMGGRELEVVEEEKDVGVLIHCSLKPSRHCQRAASAAMGVLNQIRCNFHYRDKKVYIGLYKQYVRPHVEFASPAWSPWSQADVSVIESVQKKAIKMAAGLSGTNYEQRCAEVGLDTLEERRRKQDLCQVYKIMAGIDKVDRSKLFDLVGENGRGRTRIEADSLNLRKEKFNTEVRKNFFSCRVINDWNSLPENTKRAKNIKKILRTKFQ